MVDAWKLKWVKVRNKDYPTTLGELHQQAAEDQKQKESNILLSRTGAMSSNYQMGFMNRYGTREDDFIRDRKMGGKISSRQTNGRDLASGMPRCNTIASSQGRDMRNGSAMMMGNQMEERSGIYNNASSQHFRSHQVNKQPFQSKGDSSEPQGGRRDLGPFLSRDLTGALMTGPLTSK